MGRGKTMMVMMVVMMGKRGGEHKGLVPFETAMVQHRGTRWGNGGGV